MPTVTALASVPPPPSVPPVTCVAPVLVLTAFRNRVPGPVFVRVPDPDTIAVADSDSALAPYSYIGESANDYWVFDALAYAPTTNLHRIPRAGGPAQTVMVLKNADPSAGPEMGQGLVDFAVDDQCVYVAQTQYKRAGIQLLVKAL